MIFLCATVTQILFCRPSLILTIELPLHVKFDITIIHITQTKQNENWKK